MKEELPPMIEDLFESVLEGSIEGLVGRNFPIPSAVAGFHFRMTGELDSQGIVNGANNQIVMRTDPGRQHPRVVVGSVEVGDDDHQMVVIGAPQCRLKCLVEGHFSARKGCLGQALVVALDLVEKPECLCRPALGTKGCDLILVEYDASDAIATVECPPCGQRSEFGGGD